MNVMENEMSRLAEYKEVFDKTFCTAEESAEEMKYRGTEGWNSIGHMMLMTEIESVFGISLTTQDIMNFHNYQKGIEILRKYEIEL